MKLTSLKCITCGVSNSRMLDGKADGCSRGFSLVWRRRNQLLAGYQPTSQQTSLNNFHLLNTTGIIVCTHGLAVNTPIFGREHRALDPLIADETDQVLEPDLMTPEEEEPDDGGA